MLFVAIVKGDVSLISLSASLLFLYRKLNRKIRELTDAMNQMDIIDIYRTFHPNIKEYTFFSAPHGTFCKIDHILSNKANLNRYKKNEITPCILLRSSWLKERIQQH